MTESTSTGQRGRAKKDPAMLARSWRITMTVISVVMVATGATAVFKTDVEAGPTALITIGAALFVVAAGGRAVTWFKIGETEIHTEAGREEVERALEQEEPAQALASVQTAIAYDPEILSDPFVFHTSAALYDQLVRDSIAGATDAEVTTLKPGMPVDLEVTSSGRTVGVLSKFTRQPVSHSRLKDIATKLKNRELSYAGLLLVTPHWTPRVHELVRYFREVTGLELEIVQWSGPDDDAALKVALRKFLGPTA